MVPGQRRTARLQSVSVASLRHKISAAHGHPVSGGTAVAMTAASLPALPGSVPGVPPDQCPVGSHSLASLCCRVVLPAQGCDVSVEATPSAP